MTHESQGHGKDDGTRSARQFPLFLSIEPTLRCHHNPFIGALGIINLLSFASHKSRLNRSHSQEKERDNRLSVIEALMVMGSHPCMAQAHQDVDQQDLFKELID